MEDTAKNATLAELAADIFVFSLRLRDGACADQFDVLHRGALKLFEEFEQRAKAQHVDADDLATAKYGLAAFLDEAVLSSEWPGRELWADEPLQLRFFNNYVAGWGFFEKLEAVRTRDPLNVDLLELYHLCLALGFKGKYGVEGMERLQALLKVVDGELERARPAQGQDLAPGWKAPEERSRTAERVPRWLVFACAAVLAVSLLAYGLMFVGIRVSARQTPPQAHAWLYEQSHDGAARC